MATRNAVTLASTTHATSGGSNPTYGYDNDFATAHAGTMTNPADSDPASTITLISEHTFSGSKTITQLKYQFYCSLSYSGSGSSDGYFKVEVKQNGAYTTVYNQTFGNGVTDTGVLTLSTGWAGVTDVKATAYGRTDGSAGSTCITRIYEIQAFYTIKKSYAGYV